VESLEEHISGHQIDSFTLKMHQNEVGPGFTQEPTAVAYVGWR